MKIGVLLPTFDTSAAPALAAARAAESSGLHGVFVYDHLWQLGSDAEPALSPFPVLGAVAAVTARVRLGTLVARVGLLADDLLVGGFATLQRLSGGRVVAGVGTGDRKSLPEHLAFGLPYPPAAVRRASLDRVATELVALGIETWIGGGAPQTNAISQRLSLPLNLWSATIERVEQAAKSGPTTWGGVLPEGDDGPQRLRLLAAAGASWAVFTWSGGCDRLVDAASAAGITLGD